MTREHTAGRPPPATGRPPPATDRPPSAAYSGPSQADLAAAAAADPGSLRAEIEMLRGHARALDRLIGQSERDGRAGLALLRELRQLVDCMARASRVAPAARTDREQLFDALVADVSDDLFRREAS